MMNWSTHFACCAIGLWTCFALSARAQEVSIPDPGLNAAIHQALQKPSGPLTESDLLSLTNLPAGSRNISSVKGLEAARNLRILDLDSNSLTNSRSASRLLFSAVPPLTDTDLGFRVVLECS
jgi:internalin A